MLLKPLNDLLGQTFGLLTVVGYERGTKEAKAKWVCRCACGQIRRNATADLKAGRMKSCGCMRYVAIGAKKRTHGHTAGENSRTYRIWTNMVTRCTNPNASNYRFYGGRGITVCERWREFSAFLTDMGPAPDGMSIDRIYSEGHYEPANCRWLPLSEQASNTRSNVWLETPAGRMTLSQAARASGIKVGTLQQRLKRGWPLDRAMATEPA